MTKRKGHKSRAVVKRTAKGITETTTKRGEFGVNLVNTKVTVTRDADDYETLYSEAMKDPNNGPEIFVQRVVEVCADYLNAKNLPNKKGVQLKKASDGKTELSEQPAGNYHTLDSYMETLGFDEKSEERLAAQVIVRGSKLLLGEGSHWSVVQCALEFQSAYMEFCLFRAQAEKNTHSGQRKSRRGNIMREAIAEWLNIHPGQGATKILEELERESEFGPPNEPNAGPFILFLDGGVVTAESDADPAIAHNCRRSQFADYVKDVKNSK